MSALPPPDQRTFTDEQLWALEQAHGRVAYHASPPRQRSPWAPALPADAPKPRAPFELVFRPPTPGEAKLFKAQANDASRRASAQEILARATIVAVAVTPEKGAPAVTIYDGADGGQKAAREAFDRLLITYPLAPEALGSELSELAGAARDEAEKG